MLSKVHQFSILNLLMRKIAGNISNKFFYAGSMTLALKVPSSDSFFFVYIPPFSHTSIQNWYLKAISPVLHEGKNSFKMETLKFSSLEGT